MNYSMIKYTLGWLLIFEAAFLTVPLITSLCFAEAEALHFLFAILITATIGLLLVLKKPRNTAIYARDGFVIVSLSWIFLSLFGALPFLFTGSTASFIDALFETVSGFTTTGASIFSEVESLSHGILMWRSFTHWIGGMGVLVFIMAFLPLSGGHNMHIMRAESPGPEVSKLVPRMKKTAIILYLIYFIITLLMFFILLISGMDIFESANTAFATAGTGGFGFKNDSFASYSALQQIIVTVFMLVFSINFNSYYLVIKGKIKDAINTETKVFVVIAVTAIMLITVNIIDAFDGNIWDAMRHAAFTVASLISTTGFSTADFNLWPELSRTIILLIMFVGGCAGSTAGGIKVSRITILFKGFVRELKMVVRPRQVKKITLDNRPVEHEVVRSVNAYIICYIVIFTISLIALSFENRDLITNFSAVSASLNNIGPGLGGVGPASNFGDFSVFSKLVLIFDMLAGRLELFPMLILFAPSTYRKL